MSLDHAYGELATRLIAQSKRSLSLNELLPYDRPLVQSIIQEQKDLERAIQNLREEGVLPADPRWPRVVIFATIIERNKRCLLAYHSQRLDAIHTMYWSTTRISKEIQERMSTAEIEHIHRYRESVYQFRDQLAPDDILDLAMGIEDPPRESVFITVEALVEHGPICTESGTMTFALGRRYILMKSDVEHLILQGLLREVR
ncbi:GINS complex Psf1 component [Favolaschia claudopus]|uniref:DNA replication complex GINS protein PSF1 n=1 Tax=Favolaschia claudopus TaxID=2862362 RepID=A0AAW0AS70_9AGAR